MTLVQFGLKLAIAGMALSGTVVLAQPGQTAQGAVRTAAGQPARAAASRAAKTAAKSVINGRAIDSNATPLPNVAVRLRNLPANEIEQVATANSLGEFTFVAKPEIPYVVEITDQAGRIVAVGDVITAQVGEVVGTTVSIPMRLPSLAGVFGDTASSVISAATGTGMTAMDATAAPKVSPNK